jgi:hypothetical protein
MSTGIVSVVRSRSRASREDPERDGGVCRMPRRNGCEERHDGSVARERRKGVGSLF